MIINTYVCRYGMAYALHRLPAVASIMLTQEYLEFAQQVVSSHDKADKQAELDVSASMGEMLQEMQACLTQLCGSSAVGDPEAVARMIAEKISAKNISLDAGHASEDLGEILALPPPAAKQDVILPDMPADAKRLKANLIQPLPCMIPAAASTLYCWPARVELWPSTDHHSSESLEDQGS